MLWESDFVKDIKSFTSFHPHSVVASVIMNTRVMFEWSLKFELNICLHYILDFPDFHLDGDYWAAKFSSIPPLTCDNIPRWKVSERSPHAVVVVHRNDFPLDCQMFVFLHQDCEEVRHAESGDGVLALRLRLQPLQCVDRPGMLYQPITEPD